jgi:hypothetical protein
MNGCLTPIEKGVLVALQRIHITLRGNNISKKINKKTKL